jgi:hypothetical protein
VEGNLAEEWLAIRAVILEALRSYPDARLLLAQRLSALEGGDAG